MTLSTLDIKKQLIINIIFTIFILIFGLIYEYFSHGVYSKFMQFAFLIPCVLGVLIRIILLITKKSINSKSLDLLDCANVTITLGCILKGILNIYGTTNSLLLVFVVLGSLFVLFFLVSLFVYKKS